MKRILFLLLVAVAGNRAAGQQTIVHVEEAGTLPQLIAEDTKYTINNLKVTGPLNGTDIRLLRDMAGRQDIRTATEGRLDTLDLSEARIVSGGEAYATWYGQGYVTYDDVLPSYFLLYCSQMRCFRMPETTKAIGDQVFGSCENLEELVFPEGLDSIGQAPFINCNKLTELVIPDNVTRVNYAAFQRMGGLQRITLGAGVASLGTSVFLGDNALEEVTLGKNLTDFDLVIFYTLPGLRAIRVYEANPAYCDIDGVLYSKDATTLCYHPCGREEEETYAIPASVTTIGHDAFANNVSLTAIDVPATVRSVGNSAFQNCGSLQDVTLHEGLVSVGVGAFGGCESLASVEIPASVEHVGGGAFLACTALEEIHVAEGSQSLSAHDGVLYDKEQKTLIAFPSGIDTEFYPIPETVETIETYAFAGHPTLKSAYLPQRVRTVADAVFYGCAQLQRVVFSEGVDSLGLGLIDSCDKMDAVFFLGSTPPSRVDDFALYNDRLYEQGSLFVPEAALDDYKARQWVIYREMGESEQQFKYIWGLTDADIAEITGVSPVVADPHPAGLPEVYTLDGHRTHTPQRGIAIVRGADGASRKILVK